MTEQYKENIQYITAISFLASGIILAFISFFTNDDVTAGVLTYVGEAVAFCGCVFGLGIYVRQKVNEAEQRLNNRMDNKMRKVDDLLADENP